MSDMLVRLYDLPQCVRANEYMQAEKIDIRMAMAQNKSQIVKWVKDNFNEGWSSECDVAFSNNPVTCYIAVKNNKRIIGFACYETTNKCYFGPTGVHEDFRGNGIGSILLVKSLLGLKHMGYAYGFIGGVSGAQGFYKKAVDAVEIPDSESSVYRNSLGFEKY